jgi:hypothetical protein
MSGQDLYYWPVRFGQEVVISRTIGLGSPDQWHLASQICGGVRLIAIDDLAH